MIHTYNLKGMTCGGCKASVEKYLGQVNNVTKVVADVQKAEVEVTMSSHVATETLKKALPEKYTFSEKKV
jgi:copper chaperone CopZ